MFNSLLRAAVKHWLRRYSKGHSVAQIRAVLIGDDIGNTVILEGQFAKPELEVLFKQVFEGLDPKSTALDIGANVGNHSCAFAKHFARVVAFEPNPVAYYLLKANTIGLDVDQIHKGLSDKAGELPFAENFANMGGSRIVDEPGKASSFVEVARLDDLVEPLALDNVSFVKVDVEGHEEQVFRGGKEFFRNIRPILAFEGNYASEGEVGQRVEALLRSFGYSRFRSVEAKFPKSGFSFSQLLRSRDERKSMTLVPVSNFAARNYDLIIADHG